jgi:hypothetical protein
MGFLGRSKTSREPKKMVEGALEVSGENCEHVGGFLVG